MKIKKGDTVKILAGKDSGRTGKVIRVFAKKNQALVEGINKFKKHVKKQGQDQPGGIVEIEKPIYVSKLKVTKVAKS